MTKHRHVQVSFILLLACGVTSHAAMRTIQNPQGGTILYGQVEGQTTEAGAMAALLRQLHTQYGNRPNVGKLFEVRGTQSVAAFFQVTKGRQNSQLGGMIIVAKATTEQVEAAMLFDDVSHLNSTLKPMMTRLFAEWHPFDAARAAQPAALPMRKFTTNDRSATVDLPDNWRARPQSAQGTILAEGPNGEAAILGSAILVSDLNHPIARRTYQTVQQGGLRNTVYSNAIYYPLSADLARDFVDIMQLAQKRSGQPQLKFEIAAANPVNAPADKRCAHITGHVDVRDGKGNKEMNTIFCVTAPGRAAGTFLALSSYTLLPVAVADRERPAAGSILASFNVDMAMIQRMANAYAAPAIDAIHAIGRAAAAQAAAAQRRNEIQNSSVYQHWDDMDRRSQEFSNYQLGYSVVNDIPNHAHGTLWNEDADFLVRYDPQRFEYVNAPNFWKGVDY